MWENKNTTLPQDSIILFSTYILKKPVAKATGFKCQYLNPNPN
jgi:hypothetical protein